MIVSSWKPPTSRLLNPAVRGITEWNAAFRAFAPIVIGPRVPGLLHSISRIAMNPAASRPIEPRTVTFECSDPPPPAKAVGANVLHYRKSRARRG